LSLSDREQKKCWLSTNERKRAARKTWEKTEQVFFVVVVEIVGKVVDEYSAFSQLDLASQFLL
jgi:hypothetical protein